MDLALLGVRLMESLLGKRIIFAVMGNVGI